MNDNYVVMPDGCLEKYLRKTDHSVQATVIFSKPFSRQLISNPKLNYN